MLFEIHNSTSGHSFGLVEADDAREAWDRFTADAGSPDAAPGDAIVIAESPYIQGEMLLSKDRGWVEIPQNAAV